MVKNLFFIIITGLLLSGCAGMHEQSSSKTGPAMKSSPSEGYSLHVVAPHKMDDGTVGGPYHHFCKAHSPTIIQCLLYESTQANALLVGVEYFVAKTVARDAVSFETWNKFYHDHDVEIKTGRVQVLDLPPDEVKKVAAAAAQTDGIIFFCGQKEPAPLTVSLDTLNLSDIRTARNNRTFTHRQGIDHRHVVPCRALSLSSGLITATLYLSTDPSLTGLHENPTLYLAPYEILYNRLPLKFLLFSFSQEKICLGF